MSDFLCEELMDEIFSRLPLKSLLRFRSLSKFLCRYIASPCFIRKQIFRAPQKLLIRHRTYYQDFHDDQDFCTLHMEDELPLCPKDRYIGITAVQFPFRKDFRIVGSCNGILCLFEYDLRSFTLWNPSTGRKLTLSDCPQRCFTGLEIGFGFDPITDDYKIVIIPNPQYCGGIVESSFVYAMKTRAWCVIAPPTLLFNKVVSKACFVNGALHWVVERYNFELDCAERRYSYILTFDVSTHIFGMITLPQPRRRTSQLTTIQGSLTAICLSFFYIWMWVRRDDSWSLILNLERNKFRGGLKRVLQPTNNGDLLLTTMLGESHVYCTKIGAQSRLVNLNSSSHIREMEMCVESLELLDM